MEIRLVRDMRRAYLERDDVLLEASFERLMVIVREHKSLRDRLKCITSTAITAWQPWGNSPIIQEPDGSIWLDVTELWPNQPPNPEREQSPTSAEDHP